MLFEVIQPPIQLAKNVIQPFDEIVPVVPHPNPTKVFPNRDQHPTTSRADPTLTK
jgi:hypothetical protein